MSREYRCVMIRTSGVLGGIVASDELETKLDELGRDGRELVTAFDTNLGQGRAREVVAVLEISRRVIR